MANQYEKLVAQKARLKEKMDREDLNYDNPNIMKIGKLVKPVPGG